MDTKYPRVKNKNMSVAPAPNPISQSMQVPEDQAQSSTSVSVFVSLVSPASPSVSLSSLESSDGFLVFFLGAWPVFRACIWPAMESIKRSESLVCIRRRSC